MQSQTISHGEHCLSPSGKKKRKKRVWESSTLRAKGVVPNIQDTSAETWTADLFRQLYSESLGISSFWNWATFYRISPKKINWHRIFFYHFPRLLFYPLSFIPNSTDPSSGSRCLESSLLSPQKDGEREKKTYKEGAKELPGNYICNGNIFFVIRKTLHLRMPIFWEIRRKLVTPVPFLSQKKITEYIVITEPWFKR